MSAESVEQKTGIIGDKGTWYGGIARAVAGVALGVHPIDWYRRSRRESEIRQDRLDAMGVRDPGEMFWYVDSGDWPLPAEIGMGVPQLSAEDTAAALNTVPRSAFVTDNRETL